MEPITSNDLKKEITELINSGENAYSVALFGISTHYLLGAQTEIDYDFFDFLEEVEMDAVPDAESDDGAFLELITLYYLLVENVQDFEKGVNWMPGLSPQQKQTILNWPKNYILSVFELKVMGKNVAYKDLRDGKVYDMGYAASEIGLTANNKEKIKLVSLILPTEDTYLAAPPVFYPINDLAFARMKKIPDTEEYEYAILLECSDFLDSKYSDDDVEFDDLDLSDYTFYPAVKNAGETDKSFAKRMLKQNTFFQIFAHYTQAEKLLVKVIKTFPQLFHAYTNANELLEALRLLFVGEEFDDEELTSSSDEVSIFWYTLIKEHLPKEVKAIKPYIISDGLDDDDLMF
ncbi:hypothetical protein [Enterococcus sp. AZ109]|uniref:hypothetical protein n=1 Tax=Enterococcus sp. AZ109 TaxID=2774634 RepID=UPI003F1FDCFB